MPLAATPAPGLDAWFHVTTDGERVTAVTLAPDPPKDAPDADALGESVARRLAAHARGTPDAFLDVPLAWDTVSEFQQRVLDALWRTVPAGKTVTYAALARRVGLDAGSARAVGTACAKNPWLLLVPCHRVVPASGGLGNYSGHGGVATKRRLLDIEAGRDRPRRETVATKLPI